MPFFFFSLMVSVLRCNKDGGAASKGQRGPKSTCFALVGRKITVLNLIFGVTS